MDAKVGSSIGLGTKYVSKRVDGLVKWFVTSRGYGFVIVTEMPDILVHLSTLRRDGCDVPLEGAKISLDCEERDKGWICTKVHSVDNSTGIVPVKPTPKRISTVDLRAQSPWRVVRVKWFNDAKGYGFVTPVDCKEQRDIMLHMRVVREMPNFTDGLLIMEDDTLEVCYVETEKGLQATKVRLVPK